MAHIRGFALTELAAIVVIVAVLASVLLVMGDGVRRHARLGEDLSKMRQIGAATFAYANDAADRYPTFTWQANVAYAGFPPASTALEAAANQFTHIMRTHAGRPGFPGVANIIVHPAYSQMALAAHMDWALPTDLFVSAADRHRLRWAADPQGYDAGAYAPNFGTGGGANARHPYAGSIRTTTAFFDASSVDLRVRPGTTTETLVIPTGAVLDARPLTLVAHPGQKVMLFDRVARHFGQRAPFATHFEARVPLLMADVSAAVRSAGHANLGAHPHAPAVPLRPSLEYTPTVIDPPPLTASNIVDGRFIWTRMLLAGRDFGGPEVWP